MNCITLDSVESSILQCPFLLRAPLVESETVPHKWLVIVIDNITQDQLEQVHSHVSKLYETSVAGARARGTEQKQATMAALEETQVEFIERVEAHNKAVQEGFDKMKASLTEEERKDLPESPSLKSIEHELAARMSRAQRDCKFIDDNIKQEMQRLMLFLAVIGPRPTCLGSDGWSDTIMGIPMMDALEQTWTMPGSTGVTLNCDEQLSNIAKMVPNGSHFVVMMEPSQSYPFFTIDVSARKHRVTSCAPDAIGTAFDAHTNWTKIEPDIPDARFVGRLDDSALFRSWKSDGEMLSMDDEVKAVLCSHQDISARALRVWYGESPGELLPESIWVSHPDIYSLFLVTCQIERPSIEDVKRFGLPLVCHMTLLKAMRQNLTEERSTLYLKAFWKLVGLLEGHYTLTQINSLEIG